MTTKFDSIDYMVETVTEMVNETVYNNTEQTNADRLGMDSRAGYKLFVNEDYIIVEKSESRMLDYYGGFEYIDSDYVETLGDFVFYSAQDERVQGHLDRYFNKNEENEE